LGSEARTAVPDLIELVKDRNESVRLHATFVLRCLGPEARDAVPALTECLKDPYVCTWAVIALGRIHQQPQQVVPLLMRYIQTNRNDRTSAITALSRFGADAKAAVPLLRECFSDEDKGTRFFATNAVEIIDPRTVAEAQPNEKDAQPAAALDGRRPDHRQTEASRAHHN
jgi:HEAT repeat protein